MAQFRAGQQVLVHGFQTGIGFDGGFSHYVRVPAAHAQALPAGLSLLETAILGVPGFTAAMALEHFEASGITPATGPIAVSGAAGAVGAAAIAILARAGYRVAAIDNVGATMLSWLLRSMQDGGCVASVGNAGRNTYDGSVLPFIMRRVQLVGIVANAPWSQRHRLWARLGGDLKPDFSKLLAHVHHIRLDQQMEHSERQLQGTASGRVLVAFED